MSRTSSDLSSKQYGYDMVVAVTQASINATMEQWLSKVATEPFIMGYKFNPKAIDRDHPYYPIDNWETFVGELGFDPFIVPNGTPASDAKIKALMGEYFAFAFKAQIGLPDVPLDKLPPIITFDNQGSYVTYNMVNKTFAVIGIQGDPYIGSTWLNANQADSSSVWDFQFTVDLDLQEDNIHNHFHLLPPATQQAINDLGQDAFSVQQLFLDLNTAGLSSSYAIRGLDKTSTIYVMLTGVFFDQYFAELSKDGGALLGYCVQSSKPFPSNVSLVPTALNFEISAYVDAGKPTTDYSAYTLNYLIMADGHPMSAPVPFIWNWVDKADLSKEAGTMAINRNAFRAFLSKQLSVALADLAHKPSVHFSVNLIEATISTDFKTDTAPQSFTNNNDGSKLLTYSYSASDQSSDTFVPNWGNWSVDYSASCDVSVSGTLITVFSKVNAYCHINVDGGVTTGNWASYEITTTYTVGVTADGVLEVTENTPDVVDKSQKPDPSWWSELVTVGTIDSAIKSIQGYLSPLLRGFGTGLANDVASMLNGGATWTFPGGKTFSFTNVQFSNYQDLVADLLYVTPSAS